LNGLLNNFKKKKLRLEEQAETIRSFIGQLEEVLSSNPSWDNQSRSELVKTKAEIEKYVFSQLFTTIFDNSEDHYKDIAFNDRLRKLQFIRPEHLDIPKQFWNEGLWLDAQKQLEQINSVTTPIEKLTCVLNACRVLIYLCTSVGSAAGADDFLPNLIYVTLKANVPRMHSNISYISRFCQPDVLCEENLCFYTHLIFTISFLELLESSSLSITPEEFNRLAGEAEAEDRQRRLSARSASRSSIRGS